MKIDDNFYMKLAIDEAWKYQLLTYPNPAVGCVIVKNGRLLSIEAHKEAYKDVRPIESIGGNAITQNSGNIKYLSNIGEEINKQIEKREIINSEPNYEMHKKSLDDYLLKKEEKNSTKTNISYDELILKKAIG